MNKKSKQIVFLLFFAVLFLNVQPGAGTGFEFLKVINENNSENLKYNEPFEIYYSTDDDIGGSHGVQVLIYKNSFDPPEKIEMKKENGTWTAVFVVTDTTIKSVLVAFQALDESGEPIPDKIDNNYGSYLEYLICNKEGNPVKGAFLSSAMFHTGSDGLRREDLDLALSAIKEEISLYPDNYVVFRLKYSILLKKHQYSSNVREVVGVELDSLLQVNPNNNEILQMAAGSFRMIGEIDKAEQIEKRIIDLNPRSDRAAYENLQDILEIKDSSNKLIKLESFLEEYPDSRFEEFVFSNITSTVIDLDDVEKIMQTGDKLLKIAETPSGAGSLAGIAGVFSEKNIHLDRAVRYAEKALSLTESFRYGYRPSGLSDMEWQEHISRTKARYQDVLGWALFVTGRIEDGIIHLKEAVETLPQSSTCYHYAKILSEIDPDFYYGFISENGEEPAVDSIYLRRGNPAELAMIYFARASAFGGRIGEAAYNDLNFYCQETGKDSNLINSLIEEQKEWVENDFKRRILSRKISRPAPIFELEYVQEHDWVNLESQQSNVIVICFWATWSRSSTKMLESLVDLAEVYGEDVLFLTIATDDDDEIIRKYVDRFQYPLPVLVNDGTDSEYDVQGVPVVFVLDENRNINFEHKGYRENIIEVLAVELEDLIK